MAEPRETLTIRLRDGRTLGYAEYGEPRGKPLLVFHGSPGARLQVRAAHRPALARGIRVIAPDRPGLGLSTRSPGRQIADWPGDVRELADALGVGRFPVIGVSGGGPYAAACAWRLPDRVVRAGIVSGVGPPGHGPTLCSGLRSMERALVNLALGTPWLMRAAMAVGAVPCRRWTERIYVRLRKLASPADRAILDRPEVAECLIAAMKEAFRHGGLGPAEELLLLARPWTFRPEEIRVAVRLWHGEADRIVPVEMGRYLASAIPNCQAEFIPGAGHYVVFDRIGTLLAAMTE